MADFNDNTPITFNPIGVIRSTMKQRQDSPRQGSLSDITAELHLYGGANFEPALEGLDTFERIWLVFHFDLNDSWNPKVRPPGAEKKLGVFASRSPYRPNGIGLSCVRLESIQGRVLTLSEIDLLDGTPVLDIKPYLPYADSFPDAATGWTATTNRTWEIEWEPSAQRELWLLWDLGMQSMEPFINSQLHDNPTDEKRKRIHHIKDQLYHIAYRTWVIAYSLNEDTVRILSIASAYTPERLADDEDPYGDKAIHRAYVDAIGPKPIDRSYLKKHHQ